jgi:ABC-type sugar transport system ATPase subunit
MRDGVITLNGPVSDFTRTMLVAGLLPPNTEIRNNQSQCVNIDYGDADPALVVDRLTGYGFRDVSLKVYPGEILGWRAWWSRAGRSWRRRCSAATRSKAAGCSCRAAT